MFACQPWNFSTTQAKKQTKKKQTGKQAGKQADKQTNKRENNRIRETTWIAVEMTSLYNITLPYLVCNKLAGATSGSYVK